jgi:tRNA 5-methylaminomethyl-2-thiouridine biosynthesis bifunctional protein
LVKSIETAHIEWNDAGMPIASQFDDVYFSNQNGLAETRYVFLAQNRLPERWQTHTIRHFTIAESGFGSGLNFLASWHAFLEFRKQNPSAPLKQLHFISFEKYPMSRADLRQTLSLWPELSDLADQLADTYPTIIEPGCQRLSFANGQIILDLWFGDILDSLSQIHHRPEGLVDCWFLDGFAPSKNPDMWTQALFNAMANLGKNEATFATFTAAGFVRRGLIEAGFIAAKVTGYGTKREMLAGHLPLTLNHSSEKPWTRRPASGRTEGVAIIGAGIAGASLCYALAKRGVAVTLYDAQAQAASGASGNRQGAIYPLLNPPHDDLSQFFAQAYCYNRNVIDDLVAKGHTIGHQWCGLVQLGYDEKSSQKTDNLAQRPWDSQLVQSIDSKQAQALLGLECEHGGLYYPRAGWACPGDIVQALIGEAQRIGPVTLAFEHQLTNYQASAPGVTLHFEGRPHIQCNQLVLCNSYQAQEFEPSAELPLTPVRGQVSHIRRSVTLSALKRVLCYDGYLTPIDQQSHCIGSSYGRNQTLCEYSDKESIANLAALARCVDQPWAKQLQLDSSKGRVSVRCAVRDHLPLMGALPDTTALTSSYPLLNHAPLRKQAPPLPVIANCYTITGLGARGVCSGPWLGELLAAQLLGEPLPAPQNVLDALLPSRFWVKKLLRGHRPS